MDRQDVAGRVLGGDAQELTWDAKGHLATVTEPAADGDAATAARLYAEAARKAPNIAERDHLTRQGARLNTRRSR